MLMNAVSCVIVLEISNLSSQELGPTTFSGLPLHPKPKIKVENTFKLHPDPGTEFKAHVVKRETKEVS